jgi:high affinity Mn2+ porin
MNRWIVARALLAGLLACVAVPAGRAQAPASSPGPGEGGAGRSVGGNIPEPSGQAGRAQTPESIIAPGPGEDVQGRSIGGNIPLPPGAIDEEKLPPSPWYSVNAQATVVSQGSVPFRSPYTGPNSFVSAYELRTTATATLFFIAKLPWQGGRLVINPEAAGGLGLGDVFGLGGPPNGEAVRVGNPQPTPYFARFMFQQTIELGGEWEYLAPIANQIPGPLYKNNIVFKIGKMPAIDDFDDNAYAHDPRTQFLNWGLMYNPTWDYPANTRGYTYGGDVEANIYNWSARYGVWAVPAQANQQAFDPHLLRANGHALELEQRYTILNGLPGTVRVLGWLNNAHMGSYRVALQQDPQNPDVTQTRAYRVRYGFGLSWDQQLIKDELGLFARLGYADGHAETWAFTEVERTVSLGMVLKGKRWNRPRDDVGLALLVNGLGPQHRAYLAAGGLGFELGDGKLSYAPETIGETYYNVRVRKGIFVTLDLQGVINPGYNRDRGPIGIAGLRCHFEY